MPGRRRRAGPRRQTSRPRQPRPSRRRPRRGTGRRTGRRTRRRRRPAAGPAVGPAVVVAVRPPGTPRADGCEPRTSRQPGSSSSWPVAGRGERVAVPARARGSPGRGMTPVAASRRLPGLTGGHGRRRLGRRSSGRRWSGRPRHGRPRHGRPRRRSSPRRRASRVSGSRVDHTRRRSASSWAAPGVRSSGSRAHARATRSSTAGGRAGAQRDGAGTSVVTCDQTTWNGTSPVCGCRPVSSSNRMIPAEYTSTRASTWPVCAVSGAMYSGVPSSAPVAVRLVEAARASPKSVTL